MARREHIKCPACGSQRQREAFNINARGAYDCDLAGGYEAMRSIQVIGGRGRCEWIHDDLPLDLAIALRRRLQDVLQDLENQMRAGGIEPEELD